jgi:hypothetical protein
MLNAVAAHCKTTATTSATRPPYTICRKAVSAVEGAKAVLLRMLFAPSCPKLPCICIYVSVATRCTTGMTMGRALSTQGTTCRLFMHVMFEHHYMHLH